MNTSTNKDFQITDEVVKDFIAYTGNVSSRTMLEHWEQFKSSRLSNAGVDWEILEYDCKYAGNNDVRFVRSVDGLFRNFNYNLFNWTETEDRIKSGGGTIKRVRRVSDGLTLKEDDGCLVSFDDGKGFQTSINHFTYCNGIIDVYFKEQMHQCFRLDGLDIRKKPEKTVPQPLLNDFDKLANHWDNQFVMLFERQIMEAEHQIEMGNIQLKAAKEMKEIYLQSKINP